MITPKTLRLFTKLKVFVFIDIAREGIFKIEGDPKEFTSILIQILNEVAKHMSRKGF